MTKNKSILVTAADIEEKLKDENMYENMLIYKTQNVYLSSFLISQENFRLGEVYIEDKSTNRATIEIKYDSKYKDLLENYINIYSGKKAIVNLSLYQQNIRFIMHLINKRKSGIEK